MVLPRYTQPEAEQKTLPQALKLLLPEQPKRRNGTYRYPVPMWDAQRAVRWVRFNASRYGINPDTIGVFGFSAGAMAALRPILPQILES